MHQNQLHIKYIRRISDRTSVSVVTRGFLCIQMTQMVSARGRGHAQCKDPHSSVRCDRWELNMMWKDKALRGKIITTTTTTAGGEADFFPLVLLLPLSLCLTCYTTFDLIKTLNCFWNETMIRCFGRVLVFVVSCLQPHSFPHVSSLFFLFCFSFFLILSQCHTLVD